MWLSQGETKKGPRFPREGDPRRGEGRNERHARTSTREPDLEGPRKVPDFRERGEEEGRNEQGAPHGALPDEIDEG